MAIKNHDFAELEYTGHLKENDLIFDTTDAETAKKNGFYNKSASYGPVIICIGEHQLLPGLDKNIEGKEAGKEYTIPLTAEEAFGKKDPKLLRLVPFTVFKKQNIMPAPGLQVNIDGMFGLIRNVSGGRVIVDFNHPLSGKDVYYKIKLNKLITDPAEKIRSYLKVLIGADKLDIKVENNKAEINHAELAKAPQEAKDQLAKKLKELVKEVSEIEFK